MKNVVARVRLMTMAQKSRACPCLASAMPQYAQEAPSAFLAASTSSTASTSSSNSGITSGSPATGITGPAPYLPYRLHREWRIGDVVLEDSLISRIDIRNGSFRVERDSLGGARLACYRHVTDYLGSVRTVYRMGTSWVLTPVQHITYMPSGAVLANSDGDVQQRMFCGKELQPLHGWKMYDSHARMQYNVLPRFSSTDPLCQKYYHLSPYAYCGGNPVNRIDPTGMDWYQNNQTSYYTWYDGDGAREGFTYIGGKGSVLGEFESIIDNILTDPKGPNLESLYSNGFTFDIAPNDKGALIGSQERGWDFFDEFINGSGPEFSVLLGSHPYTQELMSDAVVVSAQNKLRRGEIDVKGQITGFSRDWGLLDVFTHSSLAKQFIGSYRYDGYTSRDGRHINNVVYDSKSNTSLGYRVLNEHRRSHKRAQGNTYQFYIWQSIK